MSQSLSPTTNHDVDEPGARRGLEFVIGLAIAVILFRVFVAEAYLVPSGSMAPTLLGYHKKVVCPACSVKFTVGIDEEGYEPFAAACPNCGRKHIPIADLPISPGDRLIVQKSLFDFRRPKRWEIIVFRNPNDPRQAYVKRVVGMPGERVKVESGDVFVNGQIARKTFAEFRKLCLPVHDRSHWPIGPEIRDRWQSSNHSRWKATGSGFAIDPPLGNRTEFLDYRHLDAEGKESAIFDQTSYNQSRPTWERDPVTDLVLTFAVERWAGTGRFEVLARPRRDRDFLVRFNPSDKRVELLIGGDVVRSGNLEGWNSLVPHVIEVAHFDQRIAVRVDGMAPFDDFDLPGEPLPSLTLAQGASRPFSIGSRGLSLSIAAPRIDRDIYYSSRAARRSATEGNDKSYWLGGGEYFVLGDNSPISSDSRSWTDPAVPENLLLGKPILVHLPCQIWQAHVLGREIRCALPDLGNVRRIR